MKESEGVEVKLIAASLRNDRSNSVVWRAFALAYDIEAFGDSRETASSNLLVEVQRVYPDVKVELHVQEFRRSS